MAENPESSVNCLAEVRGKTGYGAIGRDGELGYDSLRVLFPSAWPRCETVSAHAPSVLEILCWAGFFEVF
jgi:hypothetical protein